MRYLPLSALCLVTLVLLVVGMDGPYDPENLPIYQESLDSLLTEACKNDKKCIIRSLIAADFCSVPACPKICQSKCKYLLELIWDSLYSPPLVSQLVQYVPEEIEDEKPSLRSNHFGIVSNEGKVEHSYIQSVTADQRKSTTFCSVETPTGRKKVPSGDVWTLPCSKEYGEYYTGDIFYMCSNSGTVMKTISECDFDEKKTVVKSNALSTSPRSGVPDINAKRAFEIGALFMNGLSGFLAIDKIKDFAKIAGTLSSVLGPIGIAFQLVAFFLPASDPKFDAIMGQFKEMQMKFAEISNQISKLEDVFTKLLWEGKMDVPLQNLLYLEKTLEDYSKQKTGPYLRRVQSACKRFPGDKFVTDMLQVMRSKSKNNISKIYKYNRRQFSDQFAKAMLVYSVRGTSAAVHCLGLHKNATEDDTTYLAKSQQELITDLHKITNDIYYDYIPDRAMSNYIAKHVDDFLATYHNSANDKIASAFYQQVKDAYDWYYGFGVAVYNNADSKSAAVETKCNRCVGQTNSGTYYIVHEEYGKTLVLFYAVKATPQIEQYVTDVYNYAGRDSVQPVANYFVNKGTKYPIRSANVVRFGNGLRATLSSAVYFHNVQSTSIMVSL